MINNVVADDWNHSPAGIELGKDEAHVWRASLDQDTKVIANLVALLSQDVGQVFSGLCYGAESLIDVALRGLIVRFDAKVFADRPVPEQHLYLRPSHLLQGAKIAPRLRKALCPDAP